MEDERELAGSLDVVGVGEPLACRSWGTLKRYGVSWGMAALGTRGGGCPVGQLLGEPLELGFQLPRGEFRAQYGGAGWEDPGLRVGGSP